MNDKSTPPIKEIRNLLIELINEDVDLDEIDYPRYTGEEYYGNLLPTIFHKYFIDLFSVIEYGRDLVDPERSYKVIKINGDHVYIPGDYNSWSGSYYYYDRAFYVRSVERKIELWEEIDE